MFLSFTAYFLCLYTLNFVSANQLIELKPADGASKTPTVTNQAELFLLWLHLQLISRSLIPGHISFFDEDERVQQQKLVKSLAGVNPWTLLFIAEFQKQGSARSVIY